MVEARDTGVRLTVKTKNGNFANSNISLEADNDQIYELAEAINSLQKDKHTEIVKSVTSQLSYY